MGSCSNNVLELMLLSIFIHDFKFESLKVIELGINIKGDTKDVGPTLEKIDYRIVVRKYQEDRDTKGIKEIVI